MSLSLFTMPTSKPRTIINPNVNTPRSNLRTLKGGVAPPRSAKVSYRVSRIDNPVPVAIAAIAKRNGINLETSIDPKRAVIEARKWEN